MRSGHLQFVLGADFCKNVALGAATKFDDLFKKAAAGTPDPGWDFEPDVVHIKKGTTLSVVDQGGDLTPSSEVAQFGGGFINDLNGGEAWFPSVPAAFRTSRWPRPESFKQPVPDHGSFER